MLTGISVAWKERSSEIKKQAEEITSLIGSRNDLLNRYGQITKEKISVSALLNLKEQFDLVEGGIGSAPKFPSTFCMNFLMQYYFFSKDESALKQVCLSLDKMLMGGIYDQLGGGFSRYSTDEKWLLPHFEKMLYDNALLVHTYSEAFKLTGKKEYKRVIKASTLMSLFVKERTETGRIYLMNVDHCNEHSPWTERVTMTNLCVEVTHPTKPIQHIDDPEGEIGICVLSAINLLEIKDDQDLQDTCDIIVRMLDELIDYQNYFTKAAENFTKKRRSLGIGITNLAALLAKNNLKYTDTEAPNFVDSWMEKIQYYLTSSSVDLAIEKGACEKFNQTKYAYGILPIDHYKKKIDSVITRKPTMDWEGLRKRIKQHGMRHSTLTALMPCESSSVIQSSTNGIEPPKSFITYKGSKANSVPVLIPNYSSLKNKYTLQFDMSNNIGYLNIVAALQKWVDMSISANLYYNYNHYPNKALPDALLIKEILYAYSMGIKTLYYSNTYDGDKQSAGEDSSCASGACAI